MKLWPVTNRRAFLLCLSGFFGSASTGLKRLLAQSSNLSYDGIRELLRGRKLYIVPYSHNDLAWTHTIEWQADRAAITLSEVLNLVEQIPEFRFFVDTWNEMMDPFLRRFPDKRDRFRQAVRKGKIAVAGGTFCNQHPSWMESESLIRDMTIGRRLFAELVPGLSPDVMVHNDVFPGCSQMPQILRKAGYKAYRFARPARAADRSRLPLNFRWRGLDGCEILTSWGSYGGIYTGESLGEFRGNWKEAVETFFKAEIAPLLSPDPPAVIWIPRGSDDSRPLRSGPVFDWGKEGRIPVPEFVDLWNAREESALRFATPVEYFSEVAKQQETLPVHTGVLDETMWTYWYGLNGNHSLRTWRTRVEQTLLEAECFWSCVPSEEENYPEGELKTLWTELLKTYSHAQHWLFRQDYDRQLSRLESSLSDSEQLKQRAVSQILSHVELDETLSSACLVNSLPWEREEVVRLWATVPVGITSNLRVRNEEGLELPYQVLDINWRRVRVPGGRGGTPFAESTEGGFKEVDLLVKAKVPALGYATLYFEPADGVIESPGSMGSAGDLDAGFARVEFSDRGVDSLFDSGSDTRYSGAGNVVYNEIDDVGPFHYGPVVRTLEMEGAEVSELMEGPLRSSFRLTGTIGRHEIVIQGFLYPHARRISFESEILSRGGSGHFMTLIGLPPGGQFHVDVDFGVEPRDPSMVNYESTERLRENVFFGNHWCDWSDGSKGIALIGTTGEKGYQHCPDRDLLGHFLLMTIPPAPEDSWERFITDARLGKGHHSFDYHLLLHSGDWKRGEVVRRTMEARFPIQVFYPEEAGERLPPAFPNEKSFAQVWPSEVQLSAFYREGSRYFLRVFESSGLPQEARIRLPFSVGEVKEVDFNGDVLPSGKAVSTAGDRLNFRLEAWEILTLMLRI